MTQNIFIGIIVIGSILIYCLYESIKVKRRKTDITKKYHTLISLLNHDNKKSKIAKVSRDRISLSISRIGSTIIITMIQTLGVLAAEIEISHTKYGKHRIEFFFPANSDQLKIYNSMYEDVVVFEKKQEIENSISIIFDHYIKNGQYPIAAPVRSYAAIHGADLFCIAWQNIKHMENYQSLSEGGKFEVLFLNSFMALDIFWDTLNVSYYEIEEDLISLLLFYLHRHDLIDRIKNLNKYINSRIEFYRDEVHKVNHKNNYDSSSIYSNFYIHPLLKDSPNTALINDPEFYYTIDLMLDAVKEKTSQYLQSCGVIFTPFQNISPCK